MNIREIRIIIAGGRDFTDFDYLERSTFEVIEHVQARHIKDYPFVTIISGKARGADTLGEKFGSKYGLNVKEFPADWDKYGKKAGFIRNEQMGNYAIENGNSSAILIAFWDGKSKGTENMISIAKRLGMEVHIFHYTPYLNKEQKECDSIDELTK